MSILHPSFRTLLKAASNGDGAGRERLRSHLGHCTRCQRAVAEIRTLREATRAATNVGRPEGVWEQIIARRQAGEEVILPVPSATAVRSAASRSAWRRPLEGVRAAALVASLAGVAFAAVPGSPLREWLEEHLFMDSPAHEHGSSPDGAPASAPVSGLSVHPVGGRVRIELSSPHPDLSLRVQLVGTGAVEVTATGGAASAQFNSGAGRLRISDAGAGPLAVDIPPELRSVMIVVDGTTYLEKIGDEIRVRAPHADTSGTTFVLRMGLAGSGGAGSRR